MSDHSFHFPIKKLIIMLPLYSQITAAVKNSLGRPYFLCDQKKMFLLNIHKFLCKVHKIQINRTHILKFTLLKNSL